MSDSSAPSEFFVAVTPSNTVDLPYGECRALYVGTGGPVTVVGSNGVAVLFNNAPSGSVIPVQAKRVNVTGTTATDIVALY
jgi:hypothetical protein